MYTAKHALLYKHKVHDGQAYVFYIDIRTAGKDYEEFVNRVMEEDRVLYLRGKVSKIAREGDKNLVFGVDTLSGKPVTIAADLVVLAQAIEPSAETADITHLTKTAVDIDGWAKEAHPKLRPVESLTAGIFLAGAVQGPKDIPETVGQGSAAASKVAALLSNDELMRNPETSFLHEELCTGCANCEPMCPYTAISINQTRKLAEINMALCEGCGMCSPACPSGAISLKNMTEQQIGDMIVSMIRR
jgi:heterodisulfide reductase subunit A